MSQSPKKKSKQRPALRVVKSEVLTVRPDPRVDGDIAILASRFNADIVDKLLAAAIATLSTHGMDATRITVVPVAGAWELPVLAERLARTDAFVGIVALGCILRGETAHFDVLARESACGLMQVALDHCLPIGNGVLACENIGQATARAGGEFGNKGEEAALAVLATIGSSQAIVDRFGDREAAIGQELEDMLLNDDDLFR